MRPDARDMGRLWDMLDAAKAARLFTQDRSFEEFLSNRMLRNAVERNLEIIGEAARCISEEFRQSHPEIPWRPIIALRHVLTHEYGEIRYESLWVVCSEQLGVLIGQLNAIGVDNSQKKES